MQRNMELFCGEVSLNDILEMEHAHVVYWLQKVPCKNSRGKQILSINVDRLEKYLILLDPEYVRVLFHSLNIHDLQFVLYRMTIKGCARLIARQPKESQAYIMDKLDDCTSAQIKKAIIHLPKDFYNDI